jgi:hypothetical protein
MAEELHIGVSVGERGFDRLSVDGMSAGLDLYTSRPRQAAPEVGAMSFTGERQPLKHCPPLQNDNVEKGNQSAVSRAAIT